MVTDKLGGTGPLWLPPPPPPPPPPPHQSPAAEAKVNVAPKPSLNVDESKLGGKPGTSKLTLPPGLAQDMGQINQPQGGGADVLGVAKDVKAVVGVASKVSKAPDNIKAIAEAHGQVKTELAKDGVTKIDAVKSVLKPGDANPADAPSAAPDTKLATGFKVAGGVGGLFGLANNVKDLGAGINQLAKGDVRGELTVGGAASGIVSNVGAVAGGIEAAGSVAGVGGAVVSKAALVSKALGPAAGPLTIVSGGIQTVTALTKTPPDVKSAALGGVTAAAGVAMCFPPAGTAIGGVVLAGAAIVENWGAISKGVGAATQAVGKAADTVVHDVAKVADKVENKVSDAAKAVGDFLGF